jgi:hypothetical protein
MEERQTTFSPLTPRFHSQSKQIFYFRSCAVLFRALCLSFHFEHCCSLSCASLSTFEPVVLRLAVCSFEKVSYDNGGMIMSDV